ncbi:hypothetical protein DL239_21270 [Sedimentitalea sp. CY04]|uniref:Uncharacterized protein n=1 Tax=Parasedimentitalea denitrificans TaxID=2211118 RepID=A0ABX0WCR8_9RHOB|nr:hypothetical protein [Sedimentitalea sp. CY04]NIZ63491.1 hypothetical protein [Sedimentitalea sp. CY04]
MNIIKSVWKLAMVLFLVLSLMLNVAMLLGGSLYNMTSKAFSSVTGMRTVAVQHASEVAELGSDLADERRLSRELRGEVAELSGDLAAERIASKKIRSQLSEATSGFVIYRGRRMAINEAVEMTANDISQRAVKSSSRSISSMAGEAIPYVGAAVIVGVTTLELKDLCDTVKDMNELKRAFDPELQPSEDDTTVCSMKVPTREELWELAKASPGQAWAAAKKVTPTLEDLKDYEFPDIDWTGAWNTSAAGAGKAWTATLNGVGVALDATSETTGGWVDRATKYWADEDNPVQSD